MLELKQQPSERIKKNGADIQYHIEQILKLIGEDPKREGLIDTPERVARMYEEIFSGYAVDLKDTLGVVFHERHEGMVIVKDIAYYSQCEHHMTPFFGKVHIGYIPSGTIVGLSKMARLVEAVSRRLQVQERMTCQIANVIEEVTAPHGVIVVVEGKHLCMCARGVKQSGSETITTATRGSFCHSGAERAEFLSLIK